MSVEVIGFDGVTESGRQRGWSTNDGHNLTVTYQGPSTKLEEFYNSLIGNVTVADMRFAVQQGKTSLYVLYYDTTITSGNAENNEQINTVWEVVGQEIQKDILAHEYFSTSGYDEYFIKIRKYFESKPYDSTFYATISSVQQQADYYNLLAKGTEVYIRSHFIVRKSIQVASNSQVAASWDGVDRAHAWGNAPGPDPSGSLNDKLIGAIANHPDWDSTKKQFLKCAPQIRQVAKGKFSITQDWIFAKGWSARLYAGSETP
jgi:hypothetical protein